MKKKPPPQPHRHESRSLKPKAAANTSQLPYLPDLVVENLFQYIPTKQAVRSSLVSKQWAHIWSLEVPVLDFDFDDEYNGDDHEHWRRADLFVKYLENCLEQYERCRCKEGNVSLDKFRLHIASYNSEVIPDTRVDKWLSFAVKRKVTDLDISLRLAQRNIDDDRHHGIDENQLGYYWFCTLTLVTARFLTSLNLEYVTLGNIGDRNFLPFLNEDVTLFPSLKTVSLKSVIFKNCNCVSVLISGCPSIEHLSLTSCSLSYISAAGEEQLEWLFCLLSSSLKSLQLMHCKASKVIVQATNLESFTFVSELSIHEWLVLKRCCKLKYINISTDSLKDLFLNGMGQEIVKGTINTPSLVSFTFAGALRPHILSTTAPNLRDATITILGGNLSQSPPENSHSDYLSALRDFLANFDCYRTLNWSVSSDASAEAFVFPEDFRKTLAPPFPRVKHLHRRIHCSLQIEPELKRTLCWMAPSAKIKRR